MRPRALWKNPAGEPSRTVGRCSWTGDARHEPRHRGRCTHTTGPGSSTGAMVAGPMVRPRAVPGPLQRAHLGDGPLTAISAPAQATRAQSERRTTRRETCCSLFFLPRPASPRNRNAGAPPNGPRPDGPHHRTSSLRVRFPDMGKACRDCWRPPFGGSVWLRRLPLLQPYAEPPHRANDQPRWQSAPACQALPVARPRRVKPVGQVASLPNKPGRRSGRSRPIETGLSAPVA